MLLYNIFYRNHGARRLQNLLNPVLFEFHAFPRNSLFHYIPLESDVTDIDTSKIYLSGYNKKILVDFVEQYSTDGTLSGNPRRKATIVKNSIRSFIRDNKSFRYMPNHFEVIKDPRTLLINSYGYLDTLYRYPETPMSAYDRWVNVQKTVWDKADKIADKSDRNQFVIFKMPDILPGRSFLNIYENKTSIQMLNVFDNPESLMVLHIWRWLKSSTRENSVLNAIKPENYGLINFLIYNGTNDCFLINLGYLNSWIKGNENRTDFKNQIQVEAEQLQKIFLKSLMVLQSNSDVLEEEPTAEDTDDTGYKKDELDEVEKAEIEEEFKEYYDDYGTDVEHQTTDDTNDLDNSYMSFLSKNSKNIPDEVLNKISEKSNQELINSLTDLDADLQVLEHINKTQLKNKGIIVGDKGEFNDEIPEPEVEYTTEELRAMVFIPKSTEDTLKNHLDTFAEYGLLSANDYKKAMKDMENFKNMKNPYNSKEKLVDFMQIEHSDIQIDKSKSEIVTSDNVLDSSMKESSLLSFSSDYIDKVMKKDILNMVSSLQKTGVIIKRYEIEKDISALGEYENHVLELKPIDGVSSVVRFRIPKVEDDSTMTIGGNKYIMRLQRVDLPIRKINPNTVALTSYYGKTFVDVCDKKANSTIAFISKNIDLSLVEEDTYITDLAPGAMFDNDFVAPYYYSALAEKYKSFRAGDLFFDLDHTERHRYISEDLLEKIENDPKHQCRLIGKNKKGFPLFIDYENEFYLYADNELRHIGDIFEVLRLPQVKAPVDFTEMRVYSKKIPVGVLIAYHIGFENLLKILNVKYRIEETRIFSQESHEYAIRFKDRSYVFSRKDRLHSLIVSGFLQYEKQTKTYPYKEFNKKNVYLNLLQSKGLTAIYVREIESTYQMFIDPITESILKEMNEPTTLIGLLIRSTEMLLRYDHPDSQDTSMMRIRGYERISGIIYKELTSAIRQYRNRNISGKSKIDISPYQIWKTINNDPSIKLAEDINPIQNLKDQEVVTYVGEGGRSKDSMNKASRAYHRNDIGVISESTVDSSDVGVNAYLSPNPNLENLRGIIKDDKVLEPTNILSTAALLAPNSYKDDPKRVE